MRLKEFAVVDRESRKGWAERQEAAWDMLLGHTHIEKFKLSVDHEPFRRPVGSPARPAQVCPLVG
jgi:hypothetical protein